jgi:hypothetical protein
MSTILQCRQLNSLEVIANGDYTCKFDKPVQLDPGDTISVKSCFIDTKNQNTSDIVIDEDIDVSLFFGCYNTNTSNVFADNVFVNPISLDGEKYIIYRNLQNPVDEYIHYTSITFYADVSSIGPIILWGGGYCSFDYTNTSNNTINLKVNVPNYTSPYKVNPPSGITTINIIAKKDSITNIKLDKTKSTKQPDATNFNGIPIPTGQNVYEPVIYTQTVKVLKGVYTPNDMAQTLSQNFQQINNVVKEDPLSSTNNLLTTLPIVSGYLTQNMAMITPDATKAGVCLSSLPNLFTGTSTLSFLYDDTTNKFRIDSMHNPIYDSAINRIIKGIPISSTTKDTKLVTQNCGIYIIKYEPSDFWENLLGFTSDIITTYTQTAIDVNNVTGIAFKFDNFNEGQQITGQYIGLDALVPKGQVPKKDPADPVTYFDGSTFAFPIGSIISPTNNPIIAKNASIGLGQASGYYLIEVSGLPNINDFYGENYNNSFLKGIVSRYYTINSYTSAGNESDVPFINITSQPVYIDSLKIRILNPDGTLASDIEDDNTVFLQVQKQNLLNPYVLPKIKE